MALHVAPIDTPLTGEAVHEQLVTLVVALRRPDVARALGLPAEALDAAATLLTALAAAARGGRPERPAVVSMLAQLAHAPAASLVDELAAEVRAVDAIDPRPRCAAVWCRRVVASEGEYCTAHASPRHAEDGGEECDAS